MVLALIRLARLQPGHHVPASSEAVRQEYGSEFYMLRFKVLNHALGHVKLCSHLGS